MPFLTIRFSSTGIIFEIVFSVQAQQPGEGTLEDSLLLHVLVLGFVLSLGPCVWHKSAPAIYILLTFNIKFAPFLFI